MVAESPGPRSPSGLACLQVFPSLHFGELSRVRVPSLVNSPLLIESMRSLSETMILSMILLFLNQWTELSSNHDSGEKAER